MRRFTKVSGMLLLLLMTAWTQMFADSPLFVQEKALKADQLKDGMEIAFKGISNTNTRWVNWSGQATESPTENGIFILKTSGEANKWKLQRKLDKKYIKRGAGDAIEFVESETDATILEAFCPEMNNLDIDRDDISGTKDVVFPAWAVDQNYQIRFADANDYFLNVQHQTELEQITPKFAPGRGSWSIVMVYDATVVIPEGSTGDNPTYYALKSYRSGMFMSVGNDGVPNQSSTITENCFWSFIGSTSDGVFSGKIQNNAYKGGETPYLFRNSEDNAYRYSLTAEGMTWYVKANPYPTATPQGVVISSIAELDKNQNTCIDASLNQPILGVWTPNKTTDDDWEGTTWVVTSVEDVFNEHIAEARTVLSTKGRGGYPVDAAYETLEQAFNAIEVPTTPDEYFASLEKIDEALNTFNSSDVNKLEDGYYRFECQNTNDNGKYNTYFRPNIFGSFPNIGENVIVREQNKENPSQATIWYLEAQNEEKTKYTFRNAATGEYLSNQLINGNITTSPTPSDITIVYKHKDNAGNLAIKGNDFTMFLNGDQVTNYWDGVGSIWCAVPVNAADVKLSNGYYRFLCQNEGDNNNYFRVNTLGGYESQPQNVIVREPDKANPTLASVWYVESVNPDFTQYTFRNAQTGEYLNNQSVGDNKFGTSKMPCTLFVRYGVFDGTSNEGCVQIENKASDFTMFLSNEYVSSWTTSDGSGTAWEPIAVDESELDQYINAELANQISDYYTAQRNAYDKVYFGINDYNVSGATEEKAALDATPNFANYHAYTTKVTDPKEDAVYYIVSTYASFTDGKTRAIYFDENANNPKWKICEHNEAPMLWRLARYTDSNNLDGYTIYNANNGKHIQGAGWNGTCSWRNDAYAWSILKSNAGAGEAGTNVNIVHFLATDKQTMALRAKNNTNAQPGLDETDNTLTGYNNYTAPYATQWQIIEAESVELKTNAVEGEYWATAYLPASIQLPEGARGFYVSSTTNESENSVANLTEVTDRIVPAENGALIYSDNADENGYITASIVYNSEVANLEGNLLQGSLAGTNVPDNGYILTRKESHGLGFYKINPENSKIAGNKAYLVPESGMSQIQAFSFNFDGEGDTTTDIENTVVNENATKVYYDLQGRRVLNPTKGIYITNDGKKVIFNK